VKLRKRHLRHLADAPAKRGVRLIAISLLQEADEAFTRISLNRNGSALHDFRVALRRLRSHLRIYRPWLRESVRRKLVRRLRRVARASNPSRDLEVLIERLNELQDLSEIEAAGVALLIDQFRTRQQQEVQRFRDLALLEFPPLSRRLGIGFTTYTAALQLDGEHEERLGNLAVRLSRGLRDELAEHIGHVLSIEHQEQAHEARIAGKKLRYLLEAFDRESAEVREAIAAARQFQDDLGHLHDVHVLLTELEKARAHATPEEQALLAPTHERVNQLRERVYEQVHRTFLEPRAGMVLDLVRTAEQALLRSAHVEIERRFLLRRLPRLRNAEAQIVTQGYLPGSDIKERVRVVESAKGRKYYRTLKAGTGLQRIEVEEETTEEIFKRLFSLTKGQRLRKRRYLVEADGLTWMIDRFLDRPLVLAEIELPTVDTPVQLPRWLKPVVEREVTGEAGYSNEKLAK
jgi:CHAD domain-containing protein/CYTH domain-containing protein